MNIAGCPDDFTYIQRASVKGCYKLVNRNLNWDDAGLECRSQHPDAHLVIINNAAEQKAIASTIASTPSQCTTMIHVLLYCLKFE